MLKGASKAVFFPGQKTVHGRSAGLRHFATAAVQSYCVGTGIA